MVVAVGEIVLRSYRHELDRTQGMAFSQTICSHQLN